MIEIDGPQRSFFEGNNERYIYTVYGIIGRNVVEVMRSYATWREQYEDPDMILVWRRRPELVAQEDFATNTEEWKITCRCVKVPIKGNTLPLPIAVEGQTLSRLL